MLNPQDNRGNGLPPRIAANVVWLPNNPEVPGQASDDAGLGLSHSHIDQRRVSQSALTATGSPA